MFRYFVIILIILTPLIYGCVGGTDSTTHTPITEGVEGAVVQLALRTAPAGNFQKVRVQISQGGKIIGTFPMRHLGVVHNGDEYVYEYALPERRVAETVEYMLFYTHSGIEAQDPASIITIKPKPGVKE